MKLDDAQAYAHTPAQAYAHAHAQPYTHAHAHARAYVHAHAHAPTRAHAHARSHARRSSGTFRNGYRKAPRAPKPFVHRFASKFVLKLQKWTWSSGAICGQICVCILIEMDTEMGLELQSPF